MVKKKSFMKKTFVLFVAAGVLFSGCDSYAGAGAYGGGQIGSILGSAIGGIIDGGRGSDIGTIIGMASGAVVGGAIGSAADQKREREIEAYERDRAARMAARAQRDEMYQTNAGATSRHADANYGSGFDETNSGDDRLYDFNSKDYTGNYSVQQPCAKMPQELSIDGMAEDLRYMPVLEIRNARFIDENENGVIERGEVCKLIFEVINRGNSALYDVVPTVVEASGNRNIYVSPSVHVENIMPGKGIRYTAIVQAGSRLRTGKVKLCASVIQGSNAISKVYEFNIPTKR